jgi:SAM-dependent methyltransferase
VSDVLHVTTGNPKATIVADLSRAPHIPSDLFDCIIFTQTLHLIYDLRPAIATLHRILKPGGVLLATFPGITQIDRGRWGEQWYWSFTSRSAQRLFVEAFPVANLSVQAYGSVLSALAALQGLAAEELRPAELDFCDPQFEVLVTLRAVK